MKTGWRARVCRNGSFQDYDDLRIWNIFPMYWKRLFSVAWFLSETNVTRGFSQGCVDIVRDETAGSIWRHHPVASVCVPVCVLSETDQFLGEMKSARMEVYTCTCTHAHSWQQITHSKKQTWFLALLGILFRISNDSAFVCSLSSVLRWDIKLPGVYKIFFIISYKSLSIFIISKVRSNLACSKL